jgi:hypothetical protein
VRVPVWSLVGRGSGQKNDFSDLARELD